MCLKIRAADQLRVFACLRFAAGIRPSGHYPLDVASGGTHIRCHPAFWAPIRPPVLVVGQLRIPVATCSRQYARKERETIGGGGARRDVAARPPHTRLFPLVTRTGNREAAHNEKIKKKKRGVPVPKATKSSSRRTKTKRKNKSSAIRSKKTMGSARPQGSRPPDDAIHHHDQMRGSPLLRCAPAVPHGRRGAPIAPHPSRTIRGRVQATRPPKVRGVPPPLSRAAPLPVVLGRRFALGHLETLPISLSDRSVGLGFSWRSKGVREGDGESATSLLRPTLPLTKSRNLKRNEDPLLVRDTEQLFALTSHPPSCPTIWFRGEKW
ncbi:hypothetical protein BHE74_00053037 [Ensete ventricosum]|nr:hypothetical protein GW17_00044926 [Ensete ventricosum]RWW41478.1 hypothetical protein BHE74_00053037 [Ensete ventricosum]